MVSAIILAGGLGTRLRNEVPDLPKPMAPINGKPFLEYLLDYWHTQGIEHFHLSIGYMGDKIYNYFGIKYKDAKLSYSIENKPLGTGGGLKLSLNEISSHNDLLLLNGDTFFKIPLQEIKNFHLINNSLMTLSLFKFNESKRFGEIILDKNSSIINFKEKSESLSGFANGGVYMLNKNKLRNFLQPFEREKVSLENDIIRLLIESKKILKGIKFKKPFLDIGVPKDFQKAGNFFNKLD